MYVLDFLSTSFKSLMFIFHSFKIHMYLLCLNTSVYVCMCVCTHDKILKWKSEDNFQGPVLSSIIWAPGFKHTLSGLDTVYLIDEPFYWPRSDFLL